MPEYYDLAIRWNNKKSSIRQLIRAGTVSIHGHPDYFCPGKWVAIVSKSNEIQLVFKAIAINGPRIVTLANGNTRKNGYIIKADRKTIQQPTLSDSPPLTNYLPVIGAFGYFDLTTMEEIRVGEPFPPPRKFAKNRRIKNSGNVFITHTKGIPGLPHNNPEALLVDEYALSMGETTRFGHNYIRVDNLYVDLFDLTHWQLIEAKAIPSREKIRMAIGQLRDYKRYYDRSPTLAVLLPSRPTDSCIELLTDNHIAAIWRNPSGSFTTKRWQS